MINTSGIIQKPTIDHDSMKPGTRVKFNHAVLGELTGAAWKILGNSKIAVAVYLADFDSHYLFHVNKSDIQWG